MAAPADRTRRGVIFDLDGTLIDTLDDIASSVNELLQSEGLAQQPRDAIRGMIGDGLHLLLQRASCIEDAQRVSDLADRFRPLYGARMLETSRLYEGVATMLDRVAQAAIPMSVLSNKPHDFTAPICAALLSRWRLVAVQGANDGLPKKPDPTGALRLCDEMQLAPDDVIFVGDSAVDVETARNAGMTSVAVTWGFCERGALERAAPSHVVSHPLELVRILTA